MLHYVIQLSDLKKMKSIISIIILFACILSGGCLKEPSGSVTAAELATALEIHICEIQIPAKYRSSEERFYIKEERNGGYRDLWDAFRAPRSGLNVKVFANAKTNEVTILAGGETIGGFHADSDHLPKSGGWNVGSVDYTNYRIIFSDSTEGLDRARSHPGKTTYPDPERQKKADNSKWVKYTLVAGSEIDNPPAYVTEALELDRLSKSE